MVMGSNGGAKMTWPAVKKLCTQGDIDRLACLAVVFLSSEDVDKAKYTLAAQQFGGNIKPESYKRGLWVITKKIREAEESGVLGADGDEEDAGTAKEGKEGKGGRKRKAVSDDVDKEHGGEKPVAKKGKGGRKAKVVVKEEEGGEGEAF
ncbi:hypothetical protein LTR08_001134 [Meristemomyces frigidus]|nr:hypothetical protein LTR08_001134 [Meristemomyces frigidus]